MRRLKFPEEQGDKHFTFIALRESDVASRCKSVALGENVSTLTSAWLFKARIRALAAFAEPK